MCSPATSSRTSSVGPTEHDVDAFQSLVFVGRSVKPHPVVDAHAHLVPAALVELLQTNRHGIDSVAVEPQEDGPGHWFIGQDEAGVPFRIRPFPGALSDFTQRYQWMERNSIDMQFVSVWGEMHGYNLSPTDGARWCRLINETMQDAVAHESNIRPYAAVPLSDPELAAAEVRWASESGFVGVMTGVHAGPTVLGHERYDPMWEAASSTGMVVYLHPDYPHWNDRVGAAEVANSVGRLVDTASALSNLVAYGVFRRYPDLVVIGAHGGGGFPFLWPRLRHGMQLAGSRYLSQELPAGLYFDMVVHDSRVLEHMIEAVGSERFVLGSDFPLANRDDDPVATVLGAVEDPSERRAVLVDNTARIFNRT
jgi:aminocarboxymuconate-semialdehyde decarboxylase